ncbi:hypothetical protein GGI21_001085 [Coemansia aciculifera]|uniref:Uncharacterized protein n=1 Tax=Coemansia aciculifera TaxID=417176 RepID=A0ACC1M213_9FUNG|nr:hypothetical protein IWW38_003571 [Coemansia aciculifera]KAJ2910226.1 hypothetical protein GGI21_001085 [Coemansia aciculifera]
MRLFLSIALFASTLVFAAPALLRRDLSGAVGAYNSIAGSANDAALVSNVNTFYSNLNGVADPKEITQSEKQVSDQIQANNRNKVPTSQTAAWVASVLVHFVQQ